MEADVLNALNARAAYFTGGRDRYGRWLICVPVPAELKPWSKRNMELAIHYLFATMRTDDDDDDVPTDTQPTGDAGKPTASGAQFVLLVDTQKCSNRIARSTLRHIEQIVDSAAARPGHRNDGQPALAIVVVRSDAFWDKQLVDNCAKTISSHSGTSGRSRRDEVRRSDCARSDTLDK